MHNLAHVGLYLRRAFYLTDNGICVQREDKRFEEDKL
jgi:hypothetical protein